MTIETELPSRSKTERSDSVTLMVEKLSLARIEMVGFDPNVSGQKLLRDVLSSYLINWWDASIADIRADSNILLINEDVSVLHAIVRFQDIMRPVVLLTTSRGDDVLSSVLGSLDSLGGFCRVVFKPCRPSHLFAAIKDCVKALARGPIPSPDSVASSVTRPITQQRNFLFSDEDEPRDQELQTATGNSSNGFPFPSPRQSVLRRRSDEVPIKRRPVMSARSATFVSSRSKQPMATTPSSVQVPSVPHSPSEPPGTVALADGSSLVLKSVRGSITRTSPRVLIVEDNNVNRSLLVQWLRRKVMRLMGI